VHDAIHQRPTCEEGGHLATPFLRTFLLLRSSKSTMRQLGIEENSGTVLKGCSGSRHGRRQAKKWLPAWCQDLLQGATRTRNCQNAHEPLAWQKDDEFKHRRNHVSLSRMQGA
jgi:alpha-D-ribose 1-methylphosphonate 5-triphosphate synthase subunit PhnG